MKKLFFFVLALLFLCTAGCSGKNGSQPRGNTPPKELVLAAGQNTDNYGSLGEELVSLFNQDGKTPLLKRVESPGSLGNVEMLVEGRADLALVQSDVVEASQEGAFPSKEAPQKPLQVLGVMYPETVQIITYDVTGIRKLADLRGRTISVGAAGSGSAFDARRILEAAGMSLDDVKVQYLSVEDTVKALKEGAIDAAFFTSALPHPALKDLGRQRQLVLIPVEGETLEDLLGAYPQFQKTVIPVGTYPNQLRPCASVQVPCLLVASSEMKDGQIKSFLGRLWNHWPDLRSKHMYLPLDPRQSFFRDVPMPLAPGAEQFKKDQKVSS